MDKVENHLLDKCQLKFSDLDAIQDAFVNILAGYYHTRLEYPNQKNNEDENTEVNSEESSKNSGANSTNSKKESK
jgi:hypothetical protein